MLLLVGGAGAQEADVLFVVLGKMSLYTQDVEGSITLRDHHFVAEIMPKAGGTILAGTLSSRDDPTDRYVFASEGEAFLAHGGRFDVPAKLHTAHPDGEYVFSYETASGRMDAQVLELSKRASIGDVLDAATITLTQSGRPVRADAIDPSVDLEVRWTVAREMTRNPESVVDDLTFVLAFDCFGNRIAHSGRPFQEGSFLTYRDDRFLIEADALSSGLRYSLIVEQATADAAIHEGVPGIATYATLTFLDLETIGEAKESCPVESP